MLKKFFAKKSNRQFIFFVGLTVVVSFLAANLAHASGLGDAVAQLLCWIIYGIIWCLGQLLTLVMWVLITIAQYNDFINGAPIVFGWGIVRDVCNMFFILILLIIAFGTILRVPQYNMKTLLPKLIIMAVLINFSKLICGFIIDFAQVIMLTFVNGFKEAGQGNLFNMLGLEGLLSMSNDTSGGNTDVTSWSILGTYIMALLFVVIALVTIITMVVMLAMRIIMMWVYVVLSPLAYLLSAFPQGQQYASQWWEKFSKNVIVGPVMAFFIWLAFASLGGTETPDVNNIINSNSNGTTTPTTDLGPNGGGSLPQVGISQAGSTDNMIKFIISIAMLIGGLQISQEIGGEAGAMAGKGISSLQKMKAGALKAGGRVAKSAAMNAVSNRYTRGGLGYIASRGGIGGKLLAATGIRQLATQGALKLGEHKEKVQEAAQKRVKTLGKFDSRIVKRMAREKFVGGLSNRAQQKAAQNLMPTAFAKKFNKTRGFQGVTDPKALAKIEKQFASMSADDAKALSKNELVALGKSGAKLDVNCEAYQAIGRDATKIGLINTGREDGGLVKANMLDKFGKEDAGKYGAVIDNTPGSPGEERINKLTRRDKSSKYQLKTIDETGKAAVIDEDGDELEEDDDDERMLRYKSATMAALEGETQNPLTVARNDKIKKIMGPEDKVDVSAVRKKLESWNRTMPEGENVFDYPEIMRSAIEEVNKEIRKGAGNLSVNEFSGTGRQQASNTVAVDMSKLDLGKFVPEAKSGDLSKIAGINVDDSEQIKHISGKMVELINTELGKLQAKPDKTKGDEKRMASLEAAKTKFSDPGKLKNLSIVNSAALGYKPSNIKDTKIHEELHGMGYKDEDDVQYLTQKVIDSKQYGMRSDKGTTDKLLKTNEAQRAKTNVRISGKPMKEVLGLMGGMKATAAMDKNEINAIVNNHIVVNAENDIKGIDTKLKQLTSKSGGPDKGDEDRIKSLQEDKARLSDKIENLRSAKSAAKSNGAGGTTNTSIANAEIKDLKATFSQAKGGGESNFLSFYLKSLTKAIGNLGDKIGGAGKGADKGDIIANIINKPETPPPPAGPKQPV